MSEAEIASEQSTELIKSVSIENIIQKREAFLERFTKVRTLAKEMQSLRFPSDSYLSSLPSFMWEFRGHKHEVLNSYKDNAETQLAEVTQCFDQVAWDYLMQETGMLGLMDTKQKDDWRKSLDDKKFPELTAENIAATFRDLHASRGAMFDRGVINVFKSLSWHYATNQPFKLGKRIILEYVTGYSSKSCESIDDLIRCFYVLEGKPEPQYSERVYTKVVKHNAHYPQFIETEYLDMKVYGKGTGHVTFKRLDLVQKLNEIIARHFSFHIPHDKYHADKNAA